MLAYETIICITKKTTTTTTKQHEQNKVRKTPFLTGNLHLFSIRRSFRTPKKKWDYNQLQQTIRIKEGNKGKGRKRRRRKRRKKNKND